ncbi:MAG TPA: anthrone oxygenase family protein [Pedococcus sp.]|jgi:uncharacterized membrane protein|uniref:anthrone oxygenase family protein n=1 Tax=Pedococcus sp. TaxID=2860345 RepID=UPI002F935245
MTGLMTITTAGTAVASGVLGGALFAFSSFVMPALRRLPRREGLLAMQAINEAAPRSLLMVPLLGSALGSAVVGVHAVISGPGEGRSLRVAGALLGLTGFAVTAAANIPRNNALAALDPSAPGAAARWGAYVTEWTRWNHARALAAVSSSVALAASLRGGG